MGGSFFVRRGNSLDIRFLRMASSEQNERKCENHMDFCGEMWYNTFVPPEVFSVR